MRLAAFFHPGFLWFGLLFLVPLIIHLLNRRRFRTVYWAAMEFLLQAYKKQHRRMRVENLLLLLLRCAIPLILCFAVARPYFGSDHPLSLIAEARRDVVLVLDESYSMNRQVGTNTLYQNARSQIERVTTSLQFDKGDSFTILTLSKDPRILVQGSSSLQDMTRALGDTKRPSYEEADLSKTADVLMSEVMPDIPGQAEVFIISDFQRRTFEPPLLEEDTDAGEDRVTLRRMLRRLTDEGAALRLINVADGTPVSENAGVWDLRSAESLVLAHQSLRMTASIKRSAGAGAGTGYFRIDERERPVSFEYDREGRAIVEIYESFSDATDHFVEFHLEEDELVDDNSRYLRIPVRESIPVLVVDGHPVGADQLGGEVGTLLMVLDPQYGSEDTDNLQRYFEPTWIAHHEFNQGRVRLDQYDAVILANVREIDGERMVGELENYVRRGGGVWFFMGDQVRPGSYNERLYRPDGSGLLPIPLRSAPTGEVHTPGGDPPDPSSYFRMQVGDELHPAIRTFIDDRRRGFLRAPIQRFLGFESEDIAPDTLRVPLRFERSQEPAMLDHSLDAGHVLWFATAADADWSFLPDSTKAFFPLTWDAVSYLALRDPASHQLGIGDPIRRSVPAAPEPYTVRRPDGETRLVQDLPTSPVLGHFPLEPFTDTELPGIYELDLRMGAAEPPIKEYFAVNVDPSEGELVSLEREEVTALFDRIPFEYSTEIMASEADDGPARQGEIWKTLIAVLIALVVIETIAAWRFGAYR